KRDWSSDVCSSDLSFPPSICHIYVLNSCSYRTLASFAALSIQPAFYVISVRQTRVSSRASFRFHLAMDTLASNYMLTTAGRIRDLDPLEFAQAWQTKRELKPVLYRSTFTSPY